MDSFSPYLSVVVTSRNDDHGGNLRGRMQIFTTDLLAQAERHKLPLELVFVEWNPPADRPRIKDALKWPSKFEYARVRIVEVPNALHSRYEFSDRLPLYQMIGKNVGIRRARGEFILNTNIDLIFSDALMELIASRELEKGRLYRVDRYDIRETIPEDASLDEHLEFCKKNVIRLNHFRGSADLLKGEYHQHKADDAEFHPEDYKTPLLFTNACGDFQLMDRDSWFSVRGYPEFDAFSMHIDSIFENIAHFAGFTEIRLGEPFRVYHIEHGGGWTPEQGKDGSFEKRYKEKQIRKLSDEEVNELVVTMVKKNAPTIYNDEEWGWSSEPLPEMVLGY